MSSTSNVSFTIVLAVGVIAAVSVGLWAMRSTGGAEQTVRDFVWMPDEGATIVDAVSYSSTKGGLVSVHGTVAYSEAAWQELEANLQDPSRFSPVGGSFRGVTVEAEPSPEAVRWKDGEWAAIGLTGEEVILEPENIQGVVALRWLHERPRSSKPWKSMCYAVIGGGPWSDEAQRVEPCTNYLKAPRGLRFAVRLHLDQNERRAYLAVR